MNAEAKPKTEKELVNQSLKDWSGPISSLALRLLEITSDISRLQKDLQAVFNTFRQFQEMLNARFSEFEKRLPKAEPEAPEKA